MALALTIQVQEKTIAEHALIQSIVDAVTLKGMMASFYSLQELHSLILRA
jgi:hypothetical protein